MTEDESRVRAELLERARAEHPPEYLEQSILGTMRAVRQRRVRRRSIALRISVAAGLTGIVGIALSWWPFSRGTTVEVAPEVSSVQSETPVVPKGDSVETIQQSLGSSGEGSSGEGSSGERSSGEAQRTTAPCSEPAVARGNEPLVDDFEHDRFRPARRDGRRAVWIYVTDQSDTAKDNFIVPSQLPEPERSAENQKAIHLKEGSLREWGASLELVLEGGCYDASAYRGVTFRAKGGVRVQVSAREPRIIPVSAGGTCKEDCYLGHRAAIDLSDEWKTYQVHWEEFRRRGYDAKPLDPSRLHSIQFLIEPDDTPFDVWIDDVRLLEKER